MKQLFIFASVMMFLLGCKKESTNTDNNIDQKDQKFAKILFEETEYNFGTINQGDTVRHTFVFKNDSEEPLLISNASASCGCTIPEWPKEPIKPGENGKIEVKFNSTGKSGVQNKNIAITANTLPNITNVSLKGEVKVVPVKDTTKNKIKN